MVTGLASVATLQHEAAQAVVRQGEVTLGSGVAGVLGGEAFADREAVNVVAFRAAVVSQRLSTSPSVLLLTERSRCVWFRWRLWLRAFR